MITGKLTGVRVGFVPPEGETKRRCLMNADRTPACSPPPQPHRHDTSASNACGTVTGHDISRACGEHRATLGLRADNFSKVVLVAIPFFVGDVTCFFKDCFRACGRTSIQNIEGGHDAIHQPMAVERRSLHSLGARALRCDTTGNRSTAS